MNNGDFVIEKFNSIFIANNAKGKVWGFENRYCSCFIIAFSGCLKISYDGGYIMADSTHPVFIPEGLAYKNECLEDAKSLVFNFHTVKSYAEPAALSSVSHRFATEKYEGIERALLSNTPENKMKVFSELYELAAALFASSDKLSSSDVIVNKAAEYIRTNYGLRELSVEMVARECFVSEVYLRKLFAVKLNTTPFKYITEVRMKHARNLAREKLPINEIASLVGYSDIYQFSRAYKKHFGYSPSETT